MGTAKVSALVLGGLVVVAIALVVTLFLVKVLWAWTVPDLFPGAVANGLVAKDISWLAALKVAIFVAVLAGITGHKQSK